MRALKMLLVVVVCGFSLAACGRAPSSVPSSKAPVQPAEGHGAQANLEPQIKALQAENRALKDRLALLEPPTPKWIVNPEFTEQDLAVLTEDNVRKVIRKGRSLPFVVKERDESWTPPDYSPKWHSTYPKPLPTSAVVASARHRFHLLDVFMGSIPGLFATSIALDSRPDWTRRYDFRPCGQTPEYPCYKLGEDPGSWEVYALRAHVTGVRYLDNMVVFTFKPTLRGFEVLSLDGNKLKAALGSTKQKWLVFATADGAIFEVLQR